MLRQIFVFALVVTFLPNLACKSTEGSQTSEAVGNEGDLSCSVAIVGAGVGGLYTAYRLAPQYGDKVCVFEREGRVGGRLYDIAKSPEDEQAGRIIGNGGRRIMDGQKILFDLAQELEITYDSPQTGADLIYARGHYASNKDDFVRLYPGLEYDPKEPDVESQLLKKLIQSPERKKIDKYLDIRSYVIAVVGRAGYDFLHDMNRFRADFEYPLSARSYMEYIEEEFDVCCQTHYPEGGMSAFPKRMAAKAQADGARIFLDEPVVSVDKEGRSYLLATSKRRVRAEQVVLALPAHALAKLGGAIASRIKAQQQFKDLIGVKVTVINQWFAEPWWNKVKTPDGRGIWRAYTTAHCINFVEIPPERYAVPQNVIRVVYNDQLECADMWSSLKDKPAELEAKLHEGLVHLFGDNKFTTPVAVPPATKTTYWEWPDAWYWLRRSSNFSHVDIFEWAAEPLPGEAVSLVGESYNPQRSGWSDAAYKSSIHALEKRFGMQIGGGEVYRSRY
jgi:protoporphyrinogen oxidase